MPFFGMPFPSETERDNYLKKKVAWCCTPLSIPCREDVRVVPIYFTLRRALSYTPVAYRLDLEKDRQSIDAILLTFQHRLLWMYFHGNLSYDGSTMRNWGEEDYYMYELADWMWHHSTYLESIGDHELLEYIGNNRYHLTDFGFIYQKLEYCVVNYCLQKKIFVMFGKDRLDSIQTNLTTRLITKC